MITLDGHPLKIERYPNGEVRLDVTLRMTRRIAWFYENDEEVLQLFFLSRHLRAADSPLTIGYLPYSRMDRAPGGEVFTLKYMCELINHMRFAFVEVVEPHSDVSVALLDNCYPIYCAPDLVEGDPDFLVFPDAGAEKRYHPNRTPDRVLVGTKQRDFATGTITGLRLMRSDGVMMGTDGAMGTSATIVDDLCSYGGTFVRAAQELRRIGATDITLCVTHLESSVYEGSLFDHVDRVIAWDTLQSESHHPKVTIKRRFRS